MPDYRGRFFWIELMTTDIDAAKAFYTQAIGWDTQPFDGPPPPGMEEQPYTLWTAAGVPIGGLMKLPEQARSMGAPPHWMASIGTPNVDASVEIVKELGGQVHMAPMDVPQVGRVAVVADPQGASFGLYQPAQPPDAPAEPKVGERSWSELLAGNWQQAWKFYERLFGWQKTGSTEMGPMGTYQLFGLDGQTLGGMFTKPAEVPAPPHWLYYFRVRDVNAAVARIQAGGGKVLNGPMVVPDGSTIAQCMDPQGAVFAVHMTRQ
ncbi:VOC family protein [Ramlibacter henchirensis]|uniref:VOC family protein n=1 Tax=Ramlibacter henchirensis TaxID=204072 RepID=A0A4Z0C6C7_9BURK|nr:VOC family protein [Ramlibacter henchirensis]TFZ07226.1 VOC family protein [Ramlibacter henchirensis]